jgi:hypothetical protein
MYCPNCGSNNQDGVKFCTRCGTNLELVSDALRATTTGPLETDERMVELLKDYYRSRRMTLIGGAASIIALFKLSLLLVLGFPERLLPLAALLSGLLILGLFALIWGIAKWNNSSSEIKALGFSTKQRALKPVPTELRIQADHSRIELAKETDPIVMPGSVTEHTTHLFDEPSESSSLGAASRRGEQVSQSGKSIRIRID